MTNFQTKALMVPPVEVKILEIFLPELRVIDLASVFRKAKFFLFGEKTSFWCVLVFSMYSCSQSLHGIDRSAQDP